MSSLEHKRRELEPLNTNLDSETTTLHKNLSHVPGFQSPIEIRRNPSGCNVFTLHGELSTTTIMTADDTSTDDSDPWSIDDG